jgi:hypothetical protein
MGVAIKMTAINKSSNTASGGIGHPWECVVSFCPC